MSLISENPYVCKTKNNIAKTVDMKKLLLVLSLSPLAAMAQHPFNAKPLSADKDIAVKMKPYKTDGGVINSPVRLYKNNPAPQTNRSKREFNLNEVVIGKTHYDLMTNGAMPRRIVTYPGGKVSVVWTNSAMENKDFPDRGTGYNHFDGSKWIGQDKGYVREPSDLTKFEPERAGWPNINKINDNGTEKELIVSHYAAGGNGVSGGTFWMKNANVGDPNFATFLTKDKPNGPIWARTAVTGNKVHWIGVSSDTAYTQDGVKTPMVYYRYDLSKGSFDVEKMLLPGYADRVRRGTGDEYSIDARGNTVAILAGGSANDLTLWKSTDNGENWAMTIVDSFPLAPYNPASETPFDTLWTNDGTATVTLDNDGVAHVFFPRMRIINNNLTDGGYQYFPGTDGIMYWNETTKTSQVIAARLNYDNDPETDILTGTTAQAQGSYGSNALSTFPVGAVDADNNIYMIYSSPNEEDIYFDDETNFRDLYVVFSTDGGATWSDIQSITSAPREEDVFPSVARDAADGKLHLMWMRDVDPGIFLVNEGNITQNDIMYAAIPTDDIIEGRLGQVNVSINNQTANNLFTIGNAYPNPATGTVTIPVNLKSSAKVSVKVTDMLGKTLSMQNESTLGAGSSNLTLDLSNLTPGVYFCQVNAGGYSQTQKIVVR